MATRPQQRPISTTEAASGEARKPGRLLAVEAVQRRDEARQPPGPLAATKSKRQMAYALLGRALGLQVERAIVKFVA